MRRSRQRWTNRKDANQGSHCRRRAPGNASEAKTWDWQARGHHRCHVLPCPHHLPGTSLLAIITMVTSLLEILPRHYHILARAPCEGVGGRGGDHMQDNREPVNTSARRAPHPRLDEARVSSTGTSGSVGAWFHLGSCCDTDGCRSVICSTLCICIVLLTLVL